MVLLLIAVQVKLRTKAASNAMVNSLTVPLIANEARKPKYLAFMDLGTEFKFRTGKRIAIETIIPEYKKVEVESKDEDIFRADVSRADFYLPNDSEPARLCINIRGHDVKEYPVIKKLGSALHGSAIWGVTAAGTPTWLEEEETLQTTQLDSLRPWVTRTKEERQTLVYLETMQALCILCVILILYVMFQLLIHDNGYLCSRGSK